VSRDGDEEGIFVDNNGWIGIGTLTPAEKLDVAGNISSDTLIATGFRMANGASEAWVLRSDANGNGKWQSPFKRIVSVKSAGSATVPMSEAGNFIVVQSAAAGETVTLPSTITSDDVGKGFEIYNKGTNDAMQLTASGITMTGLGSKVGPLQGVSVIIISTSEIIVIGGDI